MENTNEQGIPFNGSVATLGARITANRDLVNKYDESASKSAKQSRVCLILGLIILGISISLYRSGHWIWGTIALIVSLIVLYFFLLFRGLAAGGAYESGLLIPAMVVNTAPIEIVALANIATTEEMATQYACKKLIIKNLPLHTLRPGERIPCVAMFGGIRDGMYGNFEPRPLAWATDDAAALQNEIGRIPEEDWLFLQAVKDKVPAMKDHEIALFDSQHALIKVI